MVGITVVLAAAVAPFVFGAVQESESPPNAQISFAYDEGAESDATDSFARTKAAAGADGFVVINVESVPDGMDADQLFLQTSNSTRPWLHGHTQYSFGDTVRTGESLTTWAERGEEIRVIWESEGSDRSYTIGLFTVPNVDDVAPGGPPTPTYYCDWVEDNLNPGPDEGDLTIDGVVVECDLDQYDVWDLQIINDGALIGEAEADGDIDINTGGATYDGDVHMLDNGNTVDLDDGANINGDVIAETGGVDLDAGTSIDGEVDAEGDVDVNSNSLIEEGIVTTGNVDLTSDVTVGDKIEAEGDIDVSDGSTVEGDIESTNSGTITTTSGTVLGALATQEDVDVDSSDIQGHVYEDNGFSCSSSTINGQNCGSYAPQNYDDY
jgi:FlaG/FlaF family flagellin (archaellin)/cytoskeletal protein CcmA (bactofilin family)